MAEETSLKASGPNRAIRVVVGVAVIGVLLAALGWMVPHFIAQPARYLNPGDADGDVLGLRSPLEGRGDCGSAFWRDRRAG